MTEHVVGGMRERTKGKIMLNNSVATVKFSSGSPQVQHVEPP